MSACLIGGGDTPRMMFDFKRYLLPTICALSDPCLVEHLLKWKGSLLVVSNYVLEPIKRCMAQFLLTDFLSTRPVVIATGGSRMT